MSYEQMELLLKALGVLVGVIITLVVKPYINSRVSAEQRATINSIVETAVRCAEQSFTQEQYTKKKEYALDYTSMKLMEIGIELSTSELNALIESTVNSVKYGMEYTR